MKKLYILLLILFTSCGISYGASLSGAKLTGAEMGVSVADEESPCPSGSNYLSAWNGDYTGDTDKICYNSKASTKDGTVTGAVTLSTDYGVSGSVGALIPATDNVRLAWAVTSNDLIVTTVGTICVDFYMPAIDLATLILEVYAADINNSIYCGPIAGNAVRCSHIGTNSANQVFVTTEDTIVAETWYTVKYSWDESTQLHGVCLGKACDITAVDEAEITDTSAAFANILIGELISNGTVNIRWVDNLKIYSTYNATCE